MPLGTPTGNASYTIGGGGAYFYDHTLISGLRTNQSFLRASYDITPNVNAHVQATYAESLNYLDTRVDDRFSGTVQAINIFADNAYLRPEVRAMLGATTTFQMSRISLLDTPRNWARALNDSMQINAGLDGDFSAFGRQWTWDANVVHGANYLRTKVNEFNQRRYYAAIDAVVNPANGQIVCGVTLRNPSLEPNCVPMNIFGVGAPSQAAIDYVTWYSRYRVVNKMDIAAANLQGDLFDLPGGPFAIAVGAEYRKQTLDMASNSDPAKASTIDYTGIRGVPNGVLISNFTNLGVAHGEVNVKEAYIEVNAPLLADLPLVKAFDLNAAYRATDYSTSGLVHTWKVGFSYEPFQDLRFRGTVSRDITAPTLYQLYQGQQITQNLDLDLHTGQSAGYIREFRGNPNLTPEIGKMAVAGFVYSPSWLPGFTTSIDGYKLEIQDAIGATNQGDINLQCENSGGTDPICQYIYRPLPFSDRSAANNWTRVLLLSLNQAYVKQSGFDVEVSYGVGLEKVGLPGGLRFRALAGFITSYETKQSAIALEQNQRGIGAAPKASGSIEANYIVGPFSARLSERFTGKSRRSITQIDDNYATTPNVTYTDVNLSYKFGGQNADRYEAFFNVQNLTNEIAPIRADPANPGLQYPTLRTMYDVMGRYYTTGVRFKF
jgi:outer membrane receptor protein involved in Fe transport